MRIFKFLLRKPKKQPVQNCSTCRFNEDIACYAGTYYAAKGEYKICYEGELWEQNLTVENGGTT